MPKLPFKLLPLLAVLFVFTKKLDAQESKPYVRIAKIIVDSSQLDAYKMALKSGMEAAVRLEPGVLSLDAVYDNNQPTHITILEMYASKDAYTAHIQTAHFKKYKDQTQRMVKSLELVDVTPIEYQRKK